MGLGAAVRKVKKAPDSEPKLGGGDEEYGAVSEELADALGVPKAKREAFFEALHAFVKLCTAEED